MVLKYTKHEKNSLKSSPEFGEAWLQDRISDDPTILRLGDVDLLDRERNQGPGRLDLLLQDSELNKRYEVELMLGATDASHVIRTIEYWDIERRRYPAYEHVAVLVAEDVTSRYLNVAVSVFWLHPSCLPSAHCAESGRSSSFRVLQGAGSSWTENR